MELLNLFKRKEIRRIQHLENEIKKRDKIISELTSKYALLENALKEGEEPLSKELEICENISLVDLEDLAKKLESGRKYEKAISIYYKIIQIYEYNFQSYDRLLVLTRRIKLYDEEMQLIIEYIRKYLEYSYENGNISINDKKYFIENILDNIGKSGGVRITDDKIFDSLDIDVRIKLSELTYRYYKSKNIKLKQ